MSASTTKILVLLLFTGRLVSATGLFWKKEQKSGGKKEQKSGAQVPASDPVSQPKQEGRIRRFLNWLTSKTEPEKCNEQNSVIHDSDQQNSNQEQSEKQKINTEALKNKKKATNVANEKKSLESKEISKPIVEKLPVEKIKKEEIDFENKKKTLKKIVAPIMDKRMKNVSSRFGTWKKNVNPITGNADNTKIKKMRKEISKPIVEKLPVEKIKKEEIDFENKKKPLEATGFQSKRYDTDEREVLETTGYKKIINMKNYIPIDETTYKRNKYMKDFHDTNDL